MRRVLVLLILLTGGCSAYAQESAPALRCAATPCPPPQDGICGHPASKGAEEVYPDTAAYEKRCILRTGSSAFRRGDRLWLAFRNGMARNIQEQLGWK